MDPFFIDHAVGSVGRALEDRLPHLCANLVGTGDGLDLRWEAAGSIAPTGGDDTLRQVATKRSCCWSRRVAGMTSERAYPASSDRRFQSGRWDRGSTGSNVSN